MPFLSSNQQCQSTEGKIRSHCFLQFAFYFCRNVYQWAIWLSFDGPWQWSPRKDLEFSKFYFKNKAVSLVSPSVLWHCWLGDRKGIRLVITWMLVCCWRHLNWNFARLIAPVISTASITLRSPRGGSGVVRIDALHFLAGCHKMRLIQALSVVSLSLGFLWLCVVLLTRDSF